MSRSVDSTDRVACDWVETRWPATIWLATLTALAVLIFGNPLEQMERKGFDLALLARAQLGLTPQADLRITILGIDDEDMLELHDLAAEYSAVAKAITQASDLGAAAIVLDVIYVRGTPEISKPILVAAENGPPVVFAEALRPAAESPGNLRRLRSFPYHDQRVTPAGLMNIDVDRDGVHRSYPLMRLGEKGYEPTLALAAYFAMQALDWDKDILHPRPGVARWMELGSETSREINVLEGTPPLLNIRGPWIAGAGFFHLSLATLRKLHDSQSAVGRPLAGKVIFIGNTATGIVDSGATSFGQNEPNIVLHATALCDLLQGAEMHRTNRVGDAMMLFPIVGLMAVAGRCPNKRWMLALWVAGSATLLATGFAAILWFAVVPASLTASVLWTVVIVAELGRRHTQEFIQRERLRSTMGFYFSEKVLEDVLANQGKLAPKKRQITVLLTDLRNFTPLTLELGPEGIYKLLNQVFEVQSRAVFRQEGSLESPVGDQFLAYWGAPEPQTDPASRALRAALEIIKGLSNIRDGLADEKIQKMFNFGVGLHIGEALVGNVGSAEYMHYGPVGDPINAAARIEALTKDYQVPLLVTQSFYAALSDPKPLARVLDEVIVKGRDTPLKLMELELTSYSSQFATLAAQYAEAYTLYQCGRFNEAQIHFKRLAESDNPSRYMAGVCECLATKEMSDWNGIRRLESK